MSRVEDLWERLVHAALRRERVGIDAFGHPGTGIAGNVPSSLANNRDIDEILRAADEIQDEDPNISRICMPFAFFVFLNIIVCANFCGFIVFSMACFAYLWFPLPCCIVR